MPTKCLSSYCNFNSPYGKDYCRRCQRLEDEAKQRKDRSPMVYEWSVLCIICSQRKTLALTEATYKRLTSWPRGVKCGACGSSALEWSRVDLVTTGSSLNGTHTVLKRV